MRCHECPVWIWHEMTECWRVPEHPRLHPERECWRSPMHIRREATRLRCIADALDEAARRREAEERAVR